MTLLIKMQKTLVTFSITLMLKVRVFYIFLSKWINQNLFELIHLHKNLKRNERFNTLVFENFFSVYTKEYGSYNLYVLKVVLIFRNILLCTLPPPLSKPIILDSLPVVFLLPSIFLNNFFSSLFMSSGYSTCSKLFCFYIY